MRLPWKPSHLTVLVLVLVLVASACTAAQTPVLAPTATRPALTSVRISVAAAAVSGLPMYVAVQERFFTAHHVEVIPQSMAGNVGQTALMKGEIEFLSSPTDAITGAANGFSFKIIYSAWDRAPWTLVGKPELRSMADVRAKTIGTNRPGTAPYSYLDAGLRKAGLSIPDVRILYLNTTQDDYAALLAGQLDAAVLSPPFDLQAEAEGFHEIAFLGDDLQVPYIGLATSTAYLQEHRDIVVNVIRGMLDAGDWIRANPGGAAKHLQQYLSISPELSQAAYQKMVGTLSTTGETQPEGIRQQLAIVSTALNRPVDLAPTDVVDFGPLHEALEGHKSGRRS
jgi:ABC-type nitrate/sulfonate/bicarbonate transport system substrate-binding protein